MEVNKEEQRNLLFFYGRIVIVINIDDTWRSKIDEDIKSIEH